MSWRYLSTLSLRIKYAAVGGAVVLLLAVGITWAFISQANRWFVQNLQEKGLSKVEELSNRAVPEVVGRGGEGLAQLLDETFSDAEVAYVAVLNAKEEILGSRLRRQRLGEVPKIVLEETRQATAPTSISVPNTDGQTVYFFVTPVIDTEGASQNKLGTVVLGLSSHFIRRDIGEIIQITLPISVGALVVSCLLFVFLIEKGLRPLQDLLRLTSKIAGGDFSQRIEAHRQDEIGQLANSFNDMVDALMDRDVKRRRAEEQTKEQAEKLQGANQNLSRLLDQIARLYAAMTPLEMASTPGEMFEKIIDRLVQATGADGALFRFLDKTGKVYVCPCQRGFPQNYLDTIYKVGDGSAVDRAGQGEIIIAADISADSRLKGKRQIEAGFHSCAFLPFRVKDEVRGVFHLTSREIGYFSEERKEHLLAIARLLGIVVENSELFAEIRSAKEELEKASKVKDEFLGFVSHELKTPVNSVMGYAAMMQDGILGEVNEEQEMALAEMMSRSKELLSMINSLLEATKIEAGAVKAKRDKVALGKFLDELRSAYDVPLEKELTLTWDYPLDLPLVKTDGEKLKHILQNLINNAIKYTDRGAVKISTQCLPGAKVVKFKVADTGIGIPKDEMPFIFEMFRQVEGSQARSSGGVGLGLHIVKKFTELIGGEIEVESEPGKGSIFTVTMPCEN